MATEQDKAYREKIFKQLDSLRELQEKHVPDLVKQIKAYEAARAELSEAENRIGEAWDKVAATIGTDNQWGKALRDINHKHSEITEMEKEWVNVLELSFVQMINKGLSQETKNTAVKEKDVRKAIARLDQAAKDVGKSTMRKKKKGLDAMDEFNMVMQETEKKKDLISADVNYQCEMTYFMILQSMSKALKQKMESYEKMAVKAKELNEHLGACIKIQPDFAGAPKPAVMKDIYSEKKVSKKGMKGRSQTLSTANLPSASDNGLDSEGRPKKGPIIYSRKAEEQGKGVGTTTHSGGATLPSHHASMYLDGPVRTTDHLDLPPPPSNKSIPKAKAKWPFTPQKEGDLPFKPGDVLNVLNSVGPWWMAELNGVVGRIPANYVELVQTEPPRLQLPPHGLPMGGSGQISPRKKSPRALSAGAPLFSPHTPTAPMPAPAPVSLVDLPPPVESPRDTDLPLPDIPPPFSVSPKDSAPIDLPPPPDLTDIPAITTTPSTPKTTFDLPPPVIDDTPPPPARDPVLPPPWQQFTTDQGYVYYFNSQTGESKWTLD